MSGIRRPCVAGCTACVYGSLLGVYLPLLPSGCIGVGAGGAVGTTLIHYGTPPLCHLAQIPALGCTWAAPAAPWSSKCRSGPLRHASGDEPGQRHARTGPHRRSPTLKMMLSYQRGHDFHMCHLGHKGLHLSSVLDSFGTIWTPKSATIPTLGTLGENFDAPEPPKLR